MRDSAAGGLSINRKRVFRRVARGTVRGCGTALLIEADVDRTIVRRARRVLYFDCRPAVSGLLFFGVWHVWCFQSWCSCCIFFVNFFFVFKGGGAMHVKMGPPHKNSNNLYCGLLSFYRLLFSVCCVWCFLSFGVLVVF